MLTLANQKTISTWTFQTCEAFSWLLLHTSLSHKKISHWQYFSLVCLEWWHESGNRSCQQGTFVALSQGLAVLVAWKSWNQWNHKILRKNQSINEGLSHHIYKLCVTQIFQAYLGNFHNSINPALKLEAGFKQVTCFKRSIPAFDQRSKSDQGILEAERSAGQP